MDKPLISCSLREVLDGVGEMVAQLVSGIEEAQKNVVSSMGLQD